MARGTTLLDVDGIARHQLLSSRGHLSVTYPILEQEERRNDIFGAAGHQDQRYIDNQDNAECNKTYYNYLSRIVRTTSTQKRANRAL